MQLAILSTAQLASLATQRLGAVDSDEAIADLLRSEVTARGACLGATVIRRVENALASLRGAEQGNRVTNVYDMLESEGDFTISAGGVVNTTPIRLISLGAGQYRVVSSLPSHRIKEQLPGIGGFGIRRFAIVIGEAETAFIAAVEQARGVVISPAGWAGLELVPIADAAWIRALDCRLEWQPEIVGSLEREGPIDWQELTLSDESPRWSRRAEGATGLWRARMGHGRWVWAWTSSEHSPASGPFVTLNSDEGSRTVFAVARVAEKPVRAHLLKDGAQVRLTLAAWLPMAEYRYLAVTSSACERESGASRWTVPIDRAADVTRTLGERLGLDVRDETPA